MNRKAVQMNLAPGQKERRRQRAQTYGRQGGIGWGGDGGFAGLGQTLIHC